MTVANITKPVLKSDRFSKARGGPSQFLDIYCSRCQHYLALYQKDGHGQLLRMYLDRIFAPSDLAALQTKVFSKNAMTGFKCSHCKTLIGVPMVYEKESRLAIRLIQGAFIKRKSKGL